MKPIFVYITCKDREEAQTIGKAVVQQRLAACANILDGMESIYWWEGKLESSKETVLILKSVETKTEALINFVKEVHSYSVPCIVTLPIENGNPDYLKWIREEVR